MFNVVTRLRARLRHWVTAGRRWKARRRRINRWKRERAKILRWQVILDLGGMCMKCGCGVPEMLEVDHVDGRDWPKPAREYDSYTRARMYQEELRAGVELRVLCKPCNSGYLNHSKYARKKKRKAA